MIQSLPNRQKLKAKYWASFVGTLDDQTMFVGLYKANYKGLLDHDAPKPHRPGTDRAGTCDVYDPRLQRHLSDLIGRLLIDWGPGGRAWIQRADHQDKPILEIRATFQEPEFPGFMNFMMPLSKLSKIPQGWQTTLKASHGIYLLTCPRTKEQYVGSAQGGEGFWGRWQNYIQTGHGGNDGLKSRDPSDYQVSILEVAGSAVALEAILEMERRWKLKLQSREMGLNRNL